MSHETGVTPSGTKLVMLDFDGTLFRWGPLEGPHEPNPGAAEAAKAFKDAGYTIGIFTSRMSPTWHAEFDLDPWQEQQRVEDALLDHHIPWDFITAEKVPATLYVDDRAFRFEGDWLAVLKFLGLR